MAARHRRFRELTNHRPANLDREGGGATVRGRRACGCRKLESTRVAGDQPIYATVTQAAVMAEVCREHAWFGGFG
jgi:hypothetical protein